MRLRHGAAVLSAVAFATAALAQGPLCGADPAGAQRAESLRYAVAFRTQPAKPAVSAHFSLDVTVCARGGAPPPDALRIDARMPTHGHGMNYEPAIKELGGGRYQADGLLLHMPGRWEFVFDIIVGETRERATYSFSFP